MLKMIDNLLNLEAYTHCPDLATLNQLKGDLPFTFVSQNTRPDSFEKSYDARIFLQQEILTRSDCWHDFFNAITWMQFPRTKRLLNSWQYAAQKKRYDNGNKQRTAFENKITHFDECGVLVLSSNQAVLDKLAMHDWQGAFIENRDLFVTNNNQPNQVRVILFGHALMEKGQQPYIGLTGKALLLKTDDLINNIDARIENYLKTHQDFSLSALPLLGIPGWWPDNEKTDFYENKHYFREKRKL